MKILVMNCGSSSLKYQLIDMENEHVRAKRRSEASRPPMTILESASKVPF